MKTTFTHLLTQAGIISFIFLSSFNSFAQTEDYKVGDTLFIWAGNGLMLRKSPDLNSDPIMKLNYGEKIIIQEINDRDLEYEILKSVNHQKLVFPRIAVSGRFVKINYSGKVGYVYSGFLSKLPPINSGEDLATYFGRTVGLLKTLAKETRNNSDYKFTRIAYNNGVILQQERGNENTWRYLYFIPDISLKEAYLLINQLVDFEKNYKIALGTGSTWIETHPVKFEPNEIILQSGPYEQTNITTQPQYVVITMNGGN